MLKVGQDGFKLIGAVDQQRCFLVAVVLARMARAEAPASMVALTILPLSLITTWAVPIALIAYFILGAHLWRQRNDAMAR